MSYGQSWRDLESSFMGVGGERFVPLLYDRLLAKLHAAAEQIDAGDLEDNAGNLEDAAEIVMELISSLDFEGGGDFASQLSALYGYLASEILNVGRSLDTVKLERVIAMVAGLREACTAMFIPLAPRMHGRGGSSALPSA